MSLSNSPLLITGLFFGPLLLGLVQYLAFEPAARSWHKKLNKSPYRPPDIVHPVAWIWSYLSLGYASLMVAAEVPPSPVRLFLTVLYVVHLVLQNSWGFLFYTVRRIDLALNALLVLDVILAVLLVSVSTVQPMAAVLCLPYFCWLLELTYLNTYMWRNNEAVTKEQVIREHATPNNEDSLKQD